MIRQLLRAHEYWRMKQLSADLVIVNEKPPSYLQDLQGALEALVRGSQMRLSPETGGVRGGIFLLRGDLIPAADTRATADRCPGRAARPARHACRTGDPRRSAPRRHRRIRAAAVRGRASAEDVALPLARLEFFNGLGGFDENGREYVVGSRAKECARPSPGST